MRYVLVLVSFFVVALGQPAWVAWLAPVAAICGYALFWWARPKFWMATAWFTAVMLWQLSWMTADDYHGLYIWISWALLSMLCGVQFGLLTRLPKWVVPFGWVVMEFLRLYILAGFTWNPVGLALTAYAPSRQFAALFGVFGLSFVVMLTNVLVYRRRWAWAAAVAALPYLFGFVNTALHNPAGSPTLAVVLVQHGVLPGQREAVPRNPDQVLSPLAQWQILADLVARHEGEEVDLIVFPEGMTPYQGNALVYEQGVADVALAGALGAPPKFPLASGWLGHGGEVNSAYLCQAIANTFDCDVIAGLDWWEGEGRVYNAALHFAPGQQDPVGRYGKRVLLPFAEYLPGKWLQPLAAKYGMVSFFTPGEGPERFEAKVPVAPTVCYEETFGHLVRQNQPLDVEMLVNISNDGWYPRSRLPQQHYHLGRLRAVENGMPLVRACSTGVTAGVDSCGRVLAQLDAAPGTLRVDVPLSKHKTLYALFGDGPMLGMSFFALLLYFRSLMNSRSPGSGSR